MGIFNFLKLFIKRKEVEIKQVKLEDIDFWLNSFSKEKFTSANKDLDQIRKQILEEKEKTLQNLEKLSSTEIKDKNLPQKAIHIVEGHRKNYPRKVELFINKIDMPNDLEEIEQFCELFDEQIEDFSKNTAKGYNILKDVIGDEAAIIATNLKSFDSLVKKALKVVKKSKIGQIILIRNKIKYLKNKIDKREDLVIQINKFKKIIVDFENKIKENKEDYKKLLEEKEYQKHLQDLEDKKQLDLKKQNLVRNLTSSFSTIETALKKYERISIDNLIIRRYLDSPIKTLLEDNELEIVGIISKMKEQIESGSVELKDKKKEKSVAKANKLDRNYFNCFLNNYNKINQEIDETNRKIEKNKISKEIESIKDDLQKLEKKLEKTTNNIDNLQKQLDNIDVNLLIENVEMEIIEKLSANIKIVSN